MEGIKVHSAAIGHRKVKRLARKLNIDPIYALAHLESLWRWASVYTRDGYLAPHTDAEIAEAFRVDLLFIDPAILVTILVESGFLDRTSYGLRIHQWYHYEGADLLAQTTPRTRREEASHGPRLD